MDRKESRRILQALNLCGELICVILRQFEVIVATIGHWQSSSPFSARRRRNLNSKISGKLTRVVVSPFR